MKWRQRGLREIATRMGAVQAEYEGGIRVMTSPNRSARIPKFAPIKADRDFMLVRQRTNSAEAKARQSSKIKELRDELVSAGFNTLDRQAGALGLSRSTAWTVLRGHHKNSGLSATI